MAAADLELQAVIGFKGTVPDGLILHPDNEHLIFPLGCTVVVRNIVQRTQSFLQGHDNDVNTLTVSNSGTLMASGSTLSRPRVLLTSTLCKSTALSYCRRTPRVVYSSTQ